MDPTNIICYLEHTIGLINCLPIFGSIYYFYGCLLTVDHGVIRLYCNLWQCIYLHVLRFYRTFLCDSLLFYRHDKYTLQLVYRICENAIYKTSFLYVVCVTQHLVITYVLYLYLSKNVNNQILYDSFHKINQYMP